MANQDCNSHRMQNVWIGTHISAKLLVTKHRSIHYVRPPIYCLCILYLCKGMVYHVLYM